MNQSHGFSLKFIVSATGLGHSKLKMILSRHAELQDLPYSTRAGGARVFFRPFIEWIAKYEGKEAADKITESQESHSVTSVTRIPSGAQLHELRMIYGPDARHRLDYLIGYQATTSIVPFRPAPLPSPVDEAAVSATLDRWFGERGLSRSESRRAIAAAMAASNRTIANIVDRKERDRRTPLLNGLETGR